MLNITMGLISVNAKTAQRDTTSEIVNAVIMAETATPMNS